jgi:hypothetical protein
MTSSSLVRRALVTGALLLPLGTAGDARAQPTKGAHAAADVAQARELFTQATDLRKAGDLPGAVAKFEAAHALARTPVTAVELARTYALVGKLVEAREALLEIERMPVGAEETARSALARQDAVALAASIRPRIASLTVTVTGVPVESCTLTIDGTIVPSAAIGAARLVNTGKHMVSVSGQGADAQAEVLLAEAQSSAVTLKLLPPPTPVALASKAPVSAAAPEAQHPFRTLGYASLGVAAVGLGVGAITGALALSKASTVSSACPNQHCTTNESSAISSGRTLGDISTVGFIAAGAFAALGTFGVLYRSSSAETKPAVAWELWLGPTSGSVHGTF